MTDQLVAFLINLSTNPQLLELFKCSPTIAAHSFGLESLDVKILVDNNFDEIVRRCCIDIGGTKGNMLGEGGGEGGGGGGWPR